MATSPTADFVDTGNPAVGIDCPNCGLLTARFGWFCRNCGFALWPNAQTAAHAYRVWRLADPARAWIHQWDDMPPVEEEDVVYVDFAERAHQLGVHLFPSSNWPIVICIGVLFLMVGLVPWSMPVRLVLIAFGLVVLLFGIGGWVLREDFDFYPAGEEEGGGHGEVHH